jgi:Raf kinase inhibitor-like YbhB/YbcL family protein
MDDPDAPNGNFTHMLVYDILPTIRTLPPPEEDGDGPYASGIFGLNDTDYRGYVGPCPPGGQPHRYVFTLYAVDKRLDRMDDLDRDEITAAIEGHVLAETSLTGTFER